MGVRTTTRLTALDAAASDRPMAALPTLERELHGCLIEYEALSEAWPRGRTAMERYRIGKKVDAALKRIAELEAAIAGAKAMTLEDAAVQLRRVLARLDDASLEALVMSALGAVEAAGG